jgi:D-alanine-D-alanine ligase
MLCGMSLSIGLVYDLLGTLARRPGDPPDADAEYEPEETLLVLEAALARLGHGPVRLGNPHALLDRLGKGELPPLDAALNIAEGFGGRNRESWAPVLLELAGIPTLGSDALTLAATLDKAGTRTLVAAAGVPVPAGASVSSAEVESFAASAAWPCFVKPRWEGAAKGIRPSSVVQDVAALAREVARIERDYGQPALVEAFVPGPEYTVTIVGHAPPRALATLQRALEATTGIGVHALERHTAPSGGWRSDTPGVLDATLEARLAELALRAFDALECKDFARVDFRLDAEAAPRFLEINPLPTFAPDGSFGILAELEGRPIDALLADVLADGLARLGLSR